MASGAGGSDPVKTTSLCFFHVLTAKNDTTAARSNRAKVAPTLTPAVPPFERPWELTGPAADSELDSCVVSVASDEIVGPAEVTDVLETFNSPELLDVVEVLGLVEVLKVLKVDVVVCDLLNAAALLGLLESFAATRSSAGHPLRSQAFEEQHPKKGLFKSKQVNHSPVGS
ncbi:hypothetical protein DHEL01_v203038 [Diaporthe helianthi]|uniref:Uncharacterized protein n=1 Tax=Diaporthe helianthi TaxID=158607 RepID=A0A2P5I7W1_DIAHE|nr:hypothetical protein DHEL01_v203038 [Diaporthe helianthi]